MARAKKHSTRKKHPAKRGTAKVPKRTTASVLSNTLDPVLLAIEDYKVAYAEHDRVLTGEGAFKCGDNSPAKRKFDAASKHACFKQDDALYRLVTTKATTLAGLAEVAKFLATPMPAARFTVYDKKVCWWDEIEGNGRSRPKVYLATLAASIHDIANRTEAGGSPDPIFKLIEDWEAAEKEFLKAVSHVTACEERGLPKDGTEMLAAETALEEAKDVAADALRKVCNTPPQTLAGLTALVKAMRPDYERDEGFLDWNDGRTQNLFATLEAALVGLGDGVSGMLGADQASGAR